MDFDLFVIGGGSAGVRCARIAAGHGARVGVAEERFWGGTCVNVGCVPKKLLVQAGEYGAWADDAAGFGWTIKKGPHDWAKLIAAKDQEIGRLNGIYKRLLDNAGAKMFEARATFIDPHTLDVGGKRVTAQHIVIGTGGHPVRLPIPGAELGIISDDAFYLPHMPKRVAVLGSGYIAVEFAGIFAALGAHVDLVYRQPLPLRGFDHDMREALAEALTQQGITLHPSCTPREITADGDARALHLNNGTTISHRPGVFRHRPQTRHAEPRPRQGGRNDQRSRRGDGGSAPAHQPAQHLRDGRRHRPAEPDTGGDRRGPRARRLPVRQEPTQDFIAECADRGVLHAADRHRRSNRGTGSRGMARSMSTSASLRRCATPCRAARAGAR